MKKLRRAVKKHIFLNICVIALFVLFMGSCFNNAPPNNTTTVSKGTGFVRFNLGIAGGTILPQAPVFDAFDITFAPATGSAISKTGLSDHTQEFEIPVGTYAVAFSGYVSGIPTPVATGSVSGVAVTENSTSTVDIMLQFTVTAGEGTLTYTISAPGKTLSTATLTMENGNAPLIEIDILEAGLSGNRGGIPSGSYAATVTLITDDEIAARSEIVHIYPGQAATLSWVFDADSFSAREPINPPALFDVWLIGASATWNMQPPSLPPDPYKMTPEYENGAFTGVFTWTGNLIITPSDGNKYEGVSFISNRTGSVGWSGADWFVSTESTLANRTVQNKGGQQSFNVADNTSQAPMFRIAAAGNYTITLDTEGMTAIFVKNDYEGQAAKGKYGNYYEIFVGSFYDSDSNGMGDLNGIIQKLDYLNDGSPNSDTSLHIDGIWLMPINPSPSYHKYDVTDYKAIDSNYGTMANFENLITACKQRGIGVIIDLVVNHSSTAHPWFIAARSGSATYQAYYNVANTQLNNRYYSLGSTGKWYEAVFWDQMPDLNYDNPAVKAEMESIIDFWIGKGVAGFRLDAVQHVYETAPGQGHTAKNVEWLKWFTDYCKSKKADVYIVGEVANNDSTVQAYYASGIPLNFNFGASDNNIVRNLRTNNPQAASNFSTFVVNYNAAIRTSNSGAIDAPFLTNHDQNRLATKITGGNTMLKMAASMLLFMPGNPFIYYGDELGMTGQLEGQKDENVRGPMIWSRSNTTGKTNGPTGNNQPYWNASSVEEQLPNADSILRFYIDALKLKNRYPSIHWGTPSMFGTSTASIAMYRINGTYTGEKDLVIVHNTSGTSQSVTVSGAAVLGGTLTATGASAVKPSLAGAALTMPAYSSAVVELANN